MLDVGKRLQSDSTSNSVKRMTFHSPLHVSTRVRVRGTRKKVEREKENEPALS